MIENYLKKELSAAKDMIGTYKQNIDTIKKDMKEVDEKYRKLAEKEKESLLEAKSVCETMLEFWKNRLAAIKGDTADKTVEPAVEETTPAEETEEKVVDNLFPENNEQAPSEEPQPEEDFPGDEPAPEEAPVVEADEPEFDGSGFTSEDNFPTAPVDDFPSVEDEQPVKDLGDFLEKQKAKEQNQEAAPEDADWPEQPEDWH